MIPTIPFRCRVLDCLLESFEIDVEKLVNFLLRAGVEDASMILRLGWLDQGLKKKLFEIDGKLHLVTSGAFLPMLSLGKITEHHHHYLVSQSFSYFTNMSDVSTRRFYL